MKLIHNDQPRLIKKHNRYKFKRWKMQKDLYTETEQHMGFFSAQFRFRVQSFFFAAARPRYAVKILNCKFSI